MAQLRVGQFANLQLEKRFSPDVVVPGGVSTVTLRLRNTGAVASGPVLSTDLLDTPELAGLEYVPGSLRAASGTVQYLRAGDLPTGTEPLAVSGLNWQLTALNAGQTALLSFQLRAAGSAASGVRSNVATASGPGLDAALRAEASVSVLSVPGLALGPISNPEALGPAGEAGGEGSARDRQVQADAVIGQTACFRQTLRNTGNVADAVDIRSELEVGVGTVVLLTPDGTPLVQPLPLAAGAATDFLACLTVTGGEPDSGARLRLTAISSVGAAANSSWDTLGRLDSRVPLLRKTVSPDGTVPVGTVLTYTLRAENPYAFALTDVVIEDRLNAHLEFLGASAGGSYDQDTRNVTWHTLTLFPGQSVTLTLSARVYADTPDDTAVPNRFSLAARELPNPVSSVPVYSPVFSSSVLLDKSVAESVASIGDRLHYTVRVHNGSAVAAVQGVRLQDTPSPGLTYLPGSSALGGQPFNDPVVQGQALIWNLPDLPPRSDLTLSYQMLITPKVRTPLDNVALVAVAGQHGSLVRSSPARATVRLDAGIFAPTAEIVGVVYVDQNRDGRFQAGLDTPVQNARVLLAGGRSVLSDAQGRYHFSRLPEGVYALRLGPAGLYNPALPVPGDGGRAGTRTVTARGLTSVDFPLLPAAGNVSSLRETQLIMGEATLLKQVTAQGGGQYLVTLSLDCPAPLPELHLYDPLPSGAVLLDGSHDLRPVFTGGRATFSYRFSFGGLPEDAVTDPALDWRLP